MEGPDFRVLRLYLNYSSHCCGHVTAMYLTRSNLKKKEGFVLATVPGREYLWSTTKREEVSVNKIRRLLIAFFPKSCLKK